MDINISARQYRNRRIGDFLKELHLTEGRSTGFRKIRKSLTSNGSPEPLFITDDERSYFSAILKIHPEVSLKAQAKAQVRAQPTNKNDLTSTQMKILTESNKHALSKREMAEILKNLNISGNIKKSISTLIEMGLLQYTIPDKLTHPNQKYEITDIGKEFLSKN